MSTSRSSTNTDLDSTDSSIELSGSGPSSSSGSTSVTSLLDKLRTPRPSDLGRKQKVVTNPPHGKRKCRAGQSGIEPKSVTPSERVKKYPNESLLVSAENLAGGMSSVTQQLVSYARSCVQPGLTYFQNQLASSLKTSLAGFKAARIFSPQKANFMQPNTAAVDDLSAFPFLNSQAILDDLKTELPLYLAKAVDVDSSVSVMDWWRQNATHLPKWSSALQKVSLVQPSSAASERVFSLLNSSFNDKQEHSLQDYVEASIM